MTPTRSPDDPDLVALRDLMPLAVTLGIELSMATPGEVRGSLVWSPRLCTVGGVIHGGTLMALADTVGALVAHLNLPEGAMTSTIESKTNLFRAVTEGRVRAVARPLHVGRSTIAARTELFDHADRLVAHVVQTQSVLTPRPTESVAR